MRDKMEEDLTKRLTIEFPGVLTLEQTRDLFGYIARTMPANISYKDSRHGAFFHDPKTGILSEEQGTVKISADIRATNTPGAFDTCESVNYDRDSKFIAGIRFFVIPDYEIEDYRPEAVRLWDNVRELVEDYFYGSRESQPKQIKNKVK